MSQWRWTIEHASMELTSDAWINARDRVELVAGLVELVVRSEFKPLITPRHRRLVRAVCRLPLPAPAKWTYFYLYVIFDIYSRYVVGWTVATSESSAAAQALIEQTCLRFGIEPDQITLHADRGPPMVSKPVAFLLSDLAIAKSHSRPHVSD